MTDFFEMWSGGPRFRHFDGAYKISTDSVLLAHFSSVSRASRIVDLGCGAGVLAVLLAHKSKDSTITCVDILPEATEAAHKNILVNGFESQAVTVLGDLREHRKLFKAESFDHVVSNPPYFPTASGKSAPDELRATARDERNCTLSDLCTAASYLCRWGGIFSLVHRPERLSEVFCAMSSVGIEPKRLRMVCHRHGTAPNLVLVEGKRGGKPGLSIEPVLYLTNPDGTDSDEVQKIYHREMST